MTEEIKDITIKLKHLVIQDAELYALIMKFIDSLRIHNTAYSYIDDHHNYMPISKSVELNSLILVHRKSEEKSDYWLTKSPACCKNALYVISRCGVPVGSGRIRLSMISQGYDLDSQALDRLIQYKYLRQGSSVHERIEDNYYLSVKEFIELYNVVLLEAMIPYCPLLLDLLKIVISY